MNIRRSLAKMKAIPLVLLLSLLVSPAVSSAKIKDSFTAKADSSGKFCARVTINDGSPYLKSKKKVCLTLKQWKDNGYDIDVKKPLLESLPDKKELPA
jgi:hypothetical protein